jgi:hypothetical protein
VILGTLARAIRKRKAANQGATRASIRQETDATLFAGEPTLVVGLSLGLTWPIAHDPAPLAALVERSHEF